MVLITVLPIEMHFSTTGSRKGDETEEGPPGYPGIYFPTICAAFRSIYSAGRHRRAGVDCQSSFGCSVSLDDALGDLYSI